MKTDTTEKAGWRERFDAKWLNETAFSMVIPAKGVRCGDAEEIKDFIEQELLRARAEGFEEGLGIRTKNPGAIMSAITAQHRAEVLEEVRSGIPEENDAWEDSEDGTNGFNRYRAAVLETLERVEKGV